MFRLAVSTLLGLLAFSSFAAASPDEADTTMDSLNKVEDSLKGLQTKLLSDKSRYDREAEPAVPLDRFRFRITHANDPQTLRGSLSAV